MDLKTIPDNSKVRQIEDIIDIQKANGNINVRQVAFNLFPKTDSTISANLAKSLDSGLSKLKANILKKNKKVSHKRNLSPTLDVASWPSDSDVTVLRMKLYLTGAAKKDEGNIIPGDGLHQPDSSSMINLATLMMQSQSPSKQNLSIEYLLPINSWEQTIKSESNEFIKKKREHCPPENFQVLNLPANLHYPQNDFCLSDNNLMYASNIKSKLARFLRLYFCPCCTCLYNLENMQNEPSSYFTKKVTFMDAKSL
ncbi:uncharacterized protein LOC106719280 [Papilio machaon]|uniref:uncharacterized protein LOC106719280 n=1 Tax=Papilio machaon TaxID=76193 RepID=UPI001E6650F6|nr:uncharacterized protein LOC106719280 [Papilio machaon]